MYIFNIFRLDTLIEITTQKIKNGTGAQYFSKKYILNEFQKILELTDNDQTHKNNLNIMDKRLCRYQEIFPYKNNTVSISNKNKIINASWIHIPFEKSFIATQGPPESCIEDFWQMCFDYNVNVIVMLCRVEEDGKKKCSTYWDIKNSKDFNIVNIQYIEENDIFIKKEIIVQKFKEPSQKRSFSHIQFKQWPDHQTPNIENIFHIFENIFIFVKERKGKEPAVIHCSAGVGRTGVFLTLYILYKEIMEEIKSGEYIFVNIFNLVRKLKEFRHHLVENIMQYNFIYYFIEELLKEKNK